MQIGKNKLTPEFMTDIERRLDKHRNAVVKINVLKSARENKGDVKKYAEELLNKLGPNYTVKTIGFIINLRKWRKARVKE